ncbi:MAG: hypothetical protein R2844_20075 [Caldilineales bacterium]
MLEIIDLDKVFPAEDQAGDDNIVLAGLNLLIRRGERVGLVGPNGRASRCCFARFWARRRLAAGRSGSAPASRSATTPSGTRRSTTTRR